MRTAEDNARSIRGRRRPLDGVPRGGGAGGRRPGMQIAVTGGSHGGRPADRLRRGVIGILLVVGAFVLILMAGVYLVLLLRLNDLEDQVAKLDAEIARQNAHLAELSPYRDLKTRL